MRESRTRLLVSTATLPSSQLERLATLHPFVQQIDLVFSSHTTNARAFTALKTTHSTSQFTLSELYAYAARDTSRSFKALPVLVRDADDTWCIDPRGILTLCVSKRLYERLGVMGKKLAFKGCPEQYAIHVPLKRETTSVAMQVRHRAALAIWDEARAVADLARWTVAYVGAPAPESTTSDVAPHVRRQTDVHVPRVGDLVRSSDEDVEDHRARLDSLFEWVGMACLGAQRLYANDRVDPYVAVYEAPSPASIDDVTHVCWKGLTDDGFVQSVIDTAISVLSTSPSSGDDHNPFIAVTLHSSPMSPVAYIPETPGKEAPLRAPHPEAEDTVCLILSKTSNKTTWAICECVGQWDARWGG